MRKTLTFQLDGSTVRLTSEAGWRSAVGRGDLSPDTPVMVEIDGTEVYSGPAADAPLGDLFPDLPAPQAPRANSDTDAPLQTPAFARPDGDAPPSRSPAVVPVVRPGPNSEPEPSGRSPLTEQASERVRPGFDAPHTDKGGGKINGKPLAFAAAGFLGILVILSILARGTGESPGPAPGGEDIQPVAVAAAAPVAGTPISSDAFIEWSADEARLQPFLADGGLLIRLGQRQTPEGTAPWLQVTDASGSVHEAQGVVGFNPASARFGVVRLSPGSATPQILFLTFSGGAHCCTQVQVLDKSDQGWRTVDFGVWDGEGAPWPSDVGGGPEREFSFVDNRFLYAFAPYAGSVAPPLIFRLDNGQARDVSGDAAYKPVFARFMMETRDACARRDNAACAAHVAAAARADRLNEAWALMLRSYDHNDAWSFPTTCRRSGGECPDVDLVSWGSYPEALQAFLGETGYLPPVYVEPRDPGDRPSFSCARAPGAVLEMVCQRPELAAVDRRLAVEYARAMAFSLDREALQREQRDFLRARDQTPPDAKMLYYLYEARIARLQGCRLTTNGCGRAD